MAINWQITPTLARRLFIAIFFANGLTWVALTYSDTTIIVADTIVHLGGHEEWIGAMSRRAALQLNQLDTEADAVAFGAVWQQMFAIHSGQNGVPAGLDWNGAYPSYVEVWSIDGRRIYADPAHARAVSLLGDPEQMSPIVQNGKKYVLFRFDGPKWSLRVALHAASLLNEIGRFAPQFFRNLVVSFLVLSVPLLFAIRRGLLPLNQLSGRLAQRAVQDLSPLGFVTRYRELKPLLAALDGLLLKLRIKVQREQAFLHDAAHELRTPLAVLSAQVYVLAQANSPPAQEQARQQIDHAMARAAHLVGQLALLAGFDARVLAQDEMLDLVQLARQELAQMSGAAAASQTELTLLAPPTLWCCLERHSFQSIIQNLLDNAIRYGARTVVLTLSRTGNDLLCSVADDGPGIAPAERELVFERFYRSARHKVSGAGLGLSIVQQAAARLNARLSLSDGLAGRGCCFTVTLALAGRSPRAGREPGR
jgi:signal transduction histidine kinase